MVANLQNLCPRLKHWSLVILLSLFAVFLGNFRAIQITANSMADTISTGDYVLVSRLDWLARKQALSSLRSPHGPIVILRAADGKEFLAKRVVAVEGDTVRISRGHLVLNGAEVYEAYVRPRPLSETRGDFWPQEGEHPGMRDIVVPRGHYFVMGDNRGESTDSRHLGPVPENYVIGSVVFVWRKSWLRTLSI